MDQIRKERRGGRRQGSGRKRLAEDSRRVQMVITLNPETRDALKALAETKGVKVGRMLDMMFKPNE